MDSMVQKAQDELHAWMYEKVYKDPVAKAEEGKAKLLIEKLYGYFHKSPDKLPPYYRGTIERFSKEQAVCDYVITSYSIHYTKLYES